MVRLGGGSLADGSGFALLCLANRVEPAGGALPVCAGAATSELLLQSHDARSGSGNGIGGCSGSGNGSLLLGPELDTCAKVVQSESNDLFLVLLRKLPLHHHRAGEYGLLDSHSRILCGNTTCIRFHARWVLARPVLAAQPRP